MSDRKQLQDIIFLLEERLRNGDFAFVDNWLDRADLDSLASVSIIGALTITYWGKQELTRRDAFLQRAEVVLKRNLGEERAEKLLCRRR
jgi:hypothetical protein